MPKTNRQIEMPNAEMTSILFLLHFFAMGIAIAADKTIKVPAMMLATCSGICSFVSLNNSTVVPIRIGYPVPCRKKTVPLQFIVDVKHSYLKEGHKYETTKECLVICWFLY